MINRIVLFLFCAVPVFGASDSVLRLYNYPNPFAASEGQSTTIVFEYQNNSATDFELRYTLYVYDVAGRLVVQQERTAAVTTVNPNEVSIIWNGNNDKGEQAAPGVYFIRIVTSGGGEFVQSLSAYSKAVLQ